MSTSTLLGNWKNMEHDQGTIVPIIIRAFGTVSNGLLKVLMDLEVGGRGKTIQTAALLRTASIVKRVLQIFHSERQSAKIDVKSLNE